MAWRCGLVALLCVALGAPIWAGDVDRGSTEEDPLDRILDIDFPGGTLAKLLDLIETTIRSKANVIISEQAKSAIVPPFHLRSVTAHEIFTAISKIHLGNTVGLQASRRGNILAVTSTQAKLDPRLQKRKVQLYDVRDLLNPRGPLKVEDIVTAIETGWKMEFKVPSGELKFHQESKLLIAAGSPDELRVIENVLQELRKGTQTQRKLEEAQDVIALMQEQTKNAKADFARRIEEHKRSTERLHQQIQAYERQVTDLRERIRQLSTELEALQEEKKKKKKEEDQRRRR
ncbi:MAG: hypothetical protein ACYTHM_02620 [Planctomycetota bacterium]|jgi:type II secretory pathway component GspD/PulD (secretin)